MALADILRSSLGPNAHSKLIHTPQGEVIVSQDGAYILRQLRVTQPATVILVDSVLTLDEYVGDGTTSATILAASLIQQGYIHHVQHGIPTTTIVNGYRYALQFILATLLSEDSEMVVERTSDLQDPGQIRKAISTALSSKVSLFDDQLSQLLTDAVMRAVTRSHGDDKYVFDSKDVLFLPIAGGTLKQSEVINGILVPGQSATTVRAFLADDTADSSFRIALINDSLQRQRTRTKHNAILETPEQLHRWKIDEEQVFQDQAQSIHDAGANVVLCSGRVHEIVLHHLQRLGILCIPHVNEKVLQNASRCLDGTVIPMLAMLTSEHLGRFDRANVIEIGGHGNKFTKFLPVPPPKAVSRSRPSPVTVLIRGNTREQCNEYVRHCHDAICSVSSLSEYPQLLPGGSTFELQCIARLEQHADQMDTMDKIGVTCMAESLQIIPRTLCENSALDPNETVAFLLREHRINGKCALGVPDTNSIETADTKDTFDMSAHRVYDSLHTKRSVLQTSVNVASMVLSS